MVRGEEGVLGGVSRRRSRDGCFGTQHREERYGRVWYHSQFRFSRIHGICNSVVVFLLWWGVVQRSKTGVLRASLVLEWHGGTIAVFTKSSR